MRRISLRRSLSLVGGVLVAAALTVCAALAWTTSELRRINEQTTSNFKAVHLAEEAKIDLLLLSEEHDQSARGTLLDDLEHKLNRSNEQTTSYSERAALRRAQAGVTAIRAGRATPHDVSESIDQLIGLNAHETAVAVDRARSFDQAATALGVAVGALLLFIVGASLVLVQRNAVRPIFAIGDAMRRFGKGDRDARAADHGPAEIREMATRFNDMASALASQRNAQMTFLAGVAHDLKNPISVLKMSVALIRADDTPAAVVRETVDRVGRQIGRLERMIGNLLDMTNIEAGKLDMKFGVEDATRVTRAAVGLFEGAGTHHIITVHTPAQPTWVACDALRLEQVVTNLVSNAIKYSPNESLVEVNVERAKDHVVISVTDAGVGIAKEDQGRLFEPFRRVGLSKDTVPGVGLGLFVVKRIVDAHQGRIDIASEPGRGSTFRVVLPEHAPPK